MLAAGGTRLAGGAGLGTLRAGTALGTGATTAYRLGEATSGTQGAGGIGAGLSGVARAGAGAMAQGARGMADRLGLSQSAAAGRQAAWRATGGMTSAGPLAEASPSSQTPPAWARRLHRAQRLGGHAQMTLQAIKEGDQPGHGLAPNIRQEER